MILVHVLPVQQTSVIRSRDLAAVSVEGGGRGGGEVSVSTTVPLKAFLHRRLGCKVDDAWQHDRNRTFPNQMACTHSSTLAATRNGSGLDAQSRQFTGVIVVALHVRLL